MGVNFKMANKQNLELCGVTGLTLSDIEIIKALINWPFSTKIASAYEISLAANLAESNVSKRLRYMKSRGLVNKSISGSWHILEYLKNRIIKEFDLKKQDQRYIEAEDKPLDDKEVDKILDEAHDNKR